MSRSDSVVLSYRCPACAGHIRTKVDLFALSGDLFRLKCNCGKSALSLTKEKDGRLTLEIPCLLCPTPHRFTVAPSLFSGGRLLTLSCPVSTLPVCLVGREEEITQAEEQDDKRLSELLQDADLSSLQEARERAAEREALPDRAVEDIVRFLLCELREDGKIRCNCKDEGDYTFEFLADSLLVWCKRCGATKMLPVSNELTAMAFLETDEIDLRG